MKAIRSLLGTILAIVFLNAFGGGFYGMLGAKGIPTEWLNGSPFESYFLPSLFLFLVIGGLCLAGSIMAFRNSRYTRTVAFFCSIVLLLWIFIQIRIIGEVSWMQQAIIICALIIFGLGYFLPQKAN